MKKSLLALAVASLLPVSAMAEVVVYGKANVALQNADENGDTKIELVSNASRVGLKGSEDLGSGLKAIYQFEYETAVDDGANSNNQTFSQRNIYVGLQGASGTVMVGHFDTPTKVAQEKVDLFNDLEGDLKNVLAGENRVANIVQYVSPASWGEISTSVAYITKETDGVDNGISASLAYTGKTFYVAVALDQDVAKVDEDIVRLVGRVNIGDVQLGAIVESYDDGVTDETGAFVSALWNLNDKWALKTQYAQSDMLMADGETLSLGADYKLSKNVTLFGYYTDVSNDVLVSAKPRDDQYLGLGMEMKF